MEKQGDSYEIIVRSNICDRSIKEAMLSFNVAQVSCLSFFNHPYQDILSCHLPYFSASFHMFQ